MSRIALAAAWVAFMSLPVAETQAGNWGRWWRCQPTSTYTYSQPAYQVQSVPQAATQVTPPAPPAEGTTVRNQSVEPAVVLPAAPAPRAVAPAPTKSRGPFPGEIQQRRLRPGTPPR